MATPAEVLDHVAELREASGFGRARAAAVVFRSFASLSAAEKRDLALRVAERAAPQLVPRIEAETGLDLTRDQIQAVVDMAGRLDAQDLDELRELVHDREARGDALRTVGTADDGPAAPPPPPPDADAHDDHDIPDDLDIEAERVVLDPDPEPTVDLEAAPEPRAFTSIFDTLPDVPAWEPVAPPAPTTPWRPAVSHAAGAGGHDTDTVDLTTRVRAARQPLVERLRTAATNAARLRVLRADLDDLVDLERTGREAVVDAVPDGWARRRALEAMLDAGVLPAAEVPALILRLDSPVARAWVCASAIEADMLRVDEVDGLIDERAAERLRRRYR